MKFKLNPKKFKPIIASGSLDALKMGKNKRRLIIVHQMDK